MITANQARDKADTHLPGGEGSTTYIAVDLQQGALVTQLAITGRANTDKKLTFELLNAEARVAPRPM
jgi:hypothetical protein